MLESHVPHLETNVKCQVSKPQYVSETLSRVSGGDERNATNALWGWIDATDPPAAAQRVPHQANQAGKSCEVDMTEAFLAQWYVNKIKSNTNLYSPNPFSLLASLGFVLGKPARSKFPRIIYHICLVIHCTALRSPTHRHEEKDSKDMLCCFFFAWYSHHLYLLLIKTQASQKSKTQKKGFRWLAQNSISRYRFFRYIANSNHWKSFSSFPFFPKTKEQREGREQTGEQKERKNHIQQ